MGRYQVTSQCSIISVTAMAVDTSHRLLKEKSTLCRTLSQRIAVPQCDTLADHSLRHVPLKQARHVADPNMTDSIKSPVWDNNMDNQTIAECKLEVKDVI